MSGSNPHNDLGPTSPMQLVLFVGSLALLIVLMLWTYNYSSVCGQPTDLSFFVGLWLRELLLVAFVAIGIAGAIICRLFDFIRRTVANKNA